MPHHPDITYIGESTFRRDYKPVGLWQPDRRNHIYIVGKTGVGKSTLIRSMALQDIRYGRGLAVLDPHGDLVESLTQDATLWRPADLILLDPPGTGTPWTFNPLAGFRPTERPRAVAGLVDVFQKLWSADWGPRFEHVLRNFLSAILEYPEPHLGMLPLLATDTDFRNRVVRRVSNPTVRKFFTNEFEAYTPGMRGVVIAPLLNKVGAFLGDPRLHSVLTAPESSFNLRGCIDTRKILLVNLSKGILGEYPSALLGSLLVSSLSLAALSRADVPFKDRPDFHLYLDEFQTVSTLSLATMLSELRKFRLNLVLAHQYLGQLDARVRDAVIGNAGTHLVFRVGAQDAPLLSRELGEKIEPADLVELPNFNLYARLMIRGAVSRVVSMRLRHAA